MNRITTILSTSMLLFAGCSVQMTRIDITIPQEIPQTTPLADRKDPPSEVTQALVIVIPKKPSIPEEGSCVLKKAEKIPGDASVVISRPKGDTSDLAAMLEQQLRAGKIDFEKFKKEKEQLERSEVKGGFSADQRANISERQLEKALLEHGFTVVDRTKLEAQLRDLALATQKDSWSQDPTYLAVVKEADNLLSTKVIDTEEHKRRVAAAKSEAAAKGSERKEEKVWDIAELIRAAQGKGNISCDYLFQIDRFDVVSGGKGGFFDLNIPGIKEQIERQLSAPCFRQMERKPWVKSDIAFSAVSTGFLPTQIPMVWYEAPCSAKLINMSTGDVVWVGQYSASSMESTEITVSCTVKATPANRDAILTGIRRYNESLETARRSCEVTYAALCEAQTAANTGTLIFSDQYSADTARGQRQRRISNAQQAYDTSLQNLNACIASKPTNTGDPWTFTYEVKGWSMDPDLRVFVEGEDESLSLARKNRLEKHFQQITRVVCRSLLGTIRPLGK